MYMYMYMYIYIHTYRPDVRAVVPRALRGADAARRGPIVVQHHLFVSMYIYIYIHIHVYIYI